MTSHIKKVLIICCIAFLFCSPAVASELLHPLQAHVIHTEWFEIIYEDPQIRTAQRLASFIDDLYVQANHAFGVEPVDTLTLVVSGATQNINAYWTSEPYDHLCVYDAAPDADELASYDDTLRSVVYHELVHHVSLTMTDPESNWILRFVQRKLYLSSLMNLGTGFSEGAAVAEESIAYDGRLQNGYFLHTLVQAKAEGKARSWSEMAGTRDALSIGNWSYAFGGAFSRYLLDTYGEELYTRFWQKANHFRIKFTEGSFQTVYHLPLQQVWNDFMATIPEMHFAPGFTSSVTGKKDGLRKVSNLQAVGGNKPGIVICDLSKKKLLFYPLQDDGFYGKPETWKHIDASTSCLTVSPDGQWYALSDFAPNQKNRYRTRIIDRDSGRVLKTIDDMRQAAFVVDADGGLKLAGLKTNGYYSVLSVYDAESGRPVGERELPVNIEPYSITQGPDGTAAILMKEQGIWNISFYDVAGIDDGILKGKFEFPQSLIPRSLKATDDAGTTLTLSLAGRSMADAVPVSATVTATKTESGYELALAYDTQMVSGGLYEPVITPSGKLAAISKEPDGMRLVYDALLPRTSITLESVGASESEIPADPASPSDSSSDSASALSFPITKYHPMGYMAHGKIVPLEMYPYEANIQSVSILPSIGVSWLSSDPAQSFWYMVGGGYFPFINQVTVNLNVSGDAGPIHWSTFTQYYRSDFDLDINEIIYALLTGEPLKPAEKLYNNLLLSTDWYLGNRNWMAGISVMPQLVNDFSWRNTTAGGSASAVVQYSERRGSSPYETAGLSLAVVPYCSYRNWWDYNVGFFNYNAMVTGTVNVPHLLPFENPDRYTLNMPLWLSCSLMPVSTSSDDVLAEVGAKMILFSRELQQSFGTELFFNRFTVKAGVTVDILADVASGDITRFRSKLAAGDYDGAETREVYTLEAYMVDCVPFGSAFSSKVQMGGKLTYIPDENGEPKVTLQYLLKKGSL